MNIHGSLEEMTAIYGQIEPDKVFLVEERETLKVALQNCNGREFNPSQIDKQRHTS